MQPNSDNIIRCAVMPTCTRVSRGFEEKVTVLWNRQLQTERTIPNNKPDITFRENEKGTLLLQETGMLQEISRKFYKDLTITTQRMWNVKAK
jgi:hypothetical protein